MRNEVMRMASRVVLFNFIFLITAISNSQTQDSIAPSARSSSGSAAVQYFPTSQVSAAFAKGGVLAQTANYKVMTASRTESGNVEIHRKYTDVFYIVQGATTIVTGGKVIGEKLMESDEPRGASIEGGETRQMSAGDVIVIPAGIPHWMKEVKGTLLYFVVKVANPVQ
jgi:mannose-6-phosphate isomerase-like protein (cupin superfamily)